MTGPQPARALERASVIVAGASGGLGGEIAGVLSARGARLTLLGRDPDRIPDLPGARQVIGDLADPDTCARAVDTACDTADHLDGVVNAAGVVAFGPLVELDDDTLTELFRTNVMGPLRLVRAAIPRLTDGGFVVNLSAVVAEQPVAGMAAYSATKAALTAAGDAVRRELRRRRITVIDARPPHTETGLASHPIAGTPPRLPDGLDPRVVALRIVRAIEHDERELPSNAFD